jgi:hypothetical protein
VNRNEYVVERCKTTCTIYKHSSGTILSFKEECNEYPEEGTFDYFSRMAVVKVMPTSSPSGERKRLTIWPQGSFLFLTSIR